MKKFSAALVMIIAFGFGSSAQKKVTFSVGPELGLVADINNVLWGLGLGATAQAEFNIQEKITGTTTAGFNVYFGKSSGVGIRAKNVSVIPVRVGGRYYFSDAFYGAAQLGVGFMNFAGTQRTKFAYSPQIGYKFNRTGKAIDATLKLDGYAGKGGSFNAVGVRVAFEF